MMTDDDVQSTPVYQVGDLVSWARSDEDYGMLGLLLETGISSSHLPEARIHWHDLPEPAWLLVSDLQKV